MHPTDARCSMAVFLSLSTKQLKVRKHGWNDLLPAFKTGQVLCNV